MLVISNLLDEELETFGWGSGTQSDPSRLLPELAPLFQPKVMTAVAKVLAEAQGATQGSEVQLLSPIARETIRLSLEKHLTTTRAIADLLVLLCYKRNILV